MFRMFNFVISILLFRYLVVSITIDPGSMSQEIGCFLITRIDPLTSILAVLARSCQILTTSWQPWIPWQDSYQDLTKIIPYSKIVSYHYGQNSKIIKNTIPSVQAAETQSEGSFRPTTTISTRFHN